MEKLTAKQENVINCLLNGDSWEATKEKNSLSWKQISQLRENKLFVDELKNKQKIFFIETNNHSHIYITDALKALHLLTKNSKNERVKLEAAKSLLKAVHENIDMITTLHTRYEIDDLKKQLSLDLDLDGE
jgi:hypothetical protein